MDGCALSASMSTASLAVFSVAMAPVSPAAGIKAGMKIKTVVPNVSGLLLPGAALRPVDARLDAVKNQVQPGQELLPLGQRVGRG